MIEGRFVKLINAVSIKTELAKTELLRRVGLSSSGFSNIKNGRSNPSIPCLLSLAEYDVNYNYLFIGTGEMFNNDNVTIVKTKPGGDALEIAIDNQSKIIEILKRLQ